MLSLHCFHFPVELLNFQGKVHSMGELLDSQWPIQANSTLGSGTEISSWNKLTCIKYPFCNKPHIQSKLFFITKTLYFWYCYTILQSVKLSFERCVTQLLLLEAQDEISSLSTSILSPPSKTNLCWKYMHHNLVFSFQMETLYPFNSDFS